MAGAWAALASRVRECHDAGGRWDSYSPHLTVRSCWSDQQTAFAYVKNTHRSRLSYSPRQHLRLPGAGAKGWVSSEALGSSRECSGAPGGPRHVCGCWGQPGWPVRGPESPQFSAAGEQGGGPGHPCARPEQALVPRGSPDAAHGRASASSRHRSSRSAAPHRDPCAMEETAWTR